MTKFYTYDAWVKEFQPIPNKLTKYPDILHYETYGDEVEFVQKASNNYIWTEVDGDEGTYIISGYHYVNRIHYYITTNPWIEDIEVPTWLERQCDCCESTENGEFHPMCGECEEGYINIPIDTIDDLKALYGEKANIVG